MEHLSLLAGAGTPTREAWEAAAARVLRATGRLEDDEPDAAVWRVLCHRTLDGIEVPPLGTPETVAGLPDPGRPGHPPYTRGSVAGRRTWDVRTSLGDPDPQRSAADAATDLANGADSLWVILGRGGVAMEDLRTALEPVALDEVAVALECPEDPVGAAEAFVDLLRRRGLRAAPDSSLGVDPFGSSVRGLHPASADGSRGGARRAVLRLAELAREQGCRAATVDASAVHDVSGTEAQELGYSLAVGVAILRSLTDGAGVTVLEAAGLLEFRYAVTDDQFTSIAKLRAARRLWHRVLELSGAPDAPGQVQHAVSSRAMLTRYDPWVNLLRGTVAGFAAGAGGATSVTVLPFDSALGVPESLGRRIARNTSSLLLHEAHVGAVEDPAGGSYLVERLTEELAEAGWAELRRIEAEGGTEATLALGSGGLAQRIRDRGLVPRLREVATRERPVTGVSRFPDLDERLLERRPLPAAAPTAHRDASPFEELREQPLGTPVLLATMGPVAASAARAAWAADVLAAGGVRSLSTGATTGVGDVLAAYRRVQPPTPVVCLAGPDPAYAEWGAPLVAALREAGAAYVVLAGRPGGDTVPAALLDDSFDVGTDVLALLRRVREVLPR